MHNSGRTKGSRMHKNSGLKCWEPIHTEDSEVRRNLFIAFRDKPHVWAFYVQESLKQIGRTTPQMTKSFAADKIHFSRIQWRVLSKNKIEICAFFIVSEQFYRQRISFLKSIQWQNACRLPKRISANAIWPVKFSHLLMHIEAIKDLVCLDFRWNSLFQIQTVSTKIWRSTSSSVPLAGPAYPPPPPRRRSQLWQLPALEQAASPQQQLEPCRALLEIRKDVFLFTLTRKNCNHFSVCLSIRWSPFPQGTPFLLNVVSEGKCCKLKLKWKCVNKRLTCGQFEEHLFYFALNFLLHVFRGIVQSLECVVHHFFNDSRL